MFISTSGKGNSAPDNAGDSILRLTAKVWDLASINASIQIACKHLKCMVSCNFLIDIMQAMAEAMP